MKIMVAYDGTLQAKEALAYGINKARESRGEVVVLHVFNNRMFLDYDASADAEAVAHLESRRFVEEAKSLLREKGEGVRTSLFTAEGDPEEEVITFAKERRVDLLLCPPKFKALINRYRKAVAASESLVGACGMDLVALSAKAI
jgi:nucleotide-binding universal stress UspA family protein